MIEGAAWRRWVFFRLPLALFLIFLPLCFVNWLTDSHQELSYREDMLREHYSRTDRSNTDQMLGLNLPIEGSLMKEISCAGEHSGTCGTASVVRTVST